MTMREAADIAFVLLTEAFTLGIPNPHSGGMHLLSAVDKVRDLGVPDEEREPEQIDNNQAMQQFGAMMGTTGFKGALA